MASRSRSATRTGFERKTAVPIKPQILLRLRDESGFHFVKRWSDGALTVEGHATEEAARSHNASVPEYFLPIGNDDVAALFAEAGKVFREETTCQSK